MDYFFSRLSIGGGIIFLASFLIWFMYFGLFFVFILSKKTKKQVVFIFCASILSWILAEMTKYLLPTVRPFLLTGTNPLTLTDPFDNSFPSGHSAAAFGLATSLFLVDKKFGTIYLILASLVSVGRVLSGVHFLLDVLGGCVLGVFTSLLLDSLFFVDRRLGRKR